MPDLPLIPFTTPDSVDYSGTGGGSEKLSRPSREQQRRRLSNRFAGVDRRLATPEGLAELRRDPGSIAPERAIVFELADANSAAETYRALRNIPGFETLGDDETEAEPAHGFSTVNSKGQPTDKLVRHRLYFAMPSEEALRVLLSLWRRYENDEPFDRKSTPNQTAWRDVFDNLHDVRPWGPADRLPPEMVEAWQEDLVQLPDQRHHIEIELWYRENPRKREAASNALRARIAELDGTVIDEQVIGEIYYHAILAELPAAAIRNLIDHSSDGLSAVDEIMFLRTQTLSRIRIGDLADSDVSPIPPLAIPVEDEPIVALFDGMPLVAHTNLTGRVHLDDPHTLAAQYPRASDQQHGTAMASIILNGDGHAPTPVPHRLYVQPVTVPVGNHERFPSNRLAVHALYEALTRMLVGVHDEDGSELAPPSAPRVKIVNLSLGDPKRRFAGIVSPWARLLDHMAYKHRLLFLVSAGNIAEEFTVDAVASFMALEDAAAEERTNALLATVFARKAHRALLSPAEAINVVTVGARHADLIAPNGTGASSIDPYHHSGLPNVSSALGTGANRSAKPDLLMNGGREQLQMRSSRDPLKLMPVEQPGRFFGIQTATPGIAGELNRTRNVSGTSPATALATHSVLRIEEALRARSDLAIADDMLAVVLKALLAHSAEWDADAAAMIEQLAKDNGYDHWTHQRTEISRFLGLGYPNILRVLANTNQRALAIGYGTLTTGKAAPFPLPLPMTLSAKNEWRALTATLAWLTPIHCRHNAYRHATLDLVLDGVGKGAPLGVKKLQPQPHDDLTDRGTIVHRRWSGLDPAVFFPEQGVELKIGCRSPTKGLDQPVPYAIAVTLEVGVDSQIDVFTEINVGIRAGVPIRVRP